MKCTSSHPASSLPLASLLPAGRRFRHLITLKLDIKRNLETVVVVMAAAEVAAAAAAAAVAASRTGSNAPSTEARLASPSQARYIDPESLAFQYRDRKHSAKKGKGEVEEVYEGRLHAYDSVNDGDGMCTG
ncbi:hypothetical protein E2C01_049150 [Portunus trituberculatus]|uniref:Uncharacterized protein n=1 Tax=Portunus trituberculatus TaxID=210409 RepID=A0A5B7GDG0_PORTR|nr:hypothetical protein [Portunus trituberculatus]